MPGFSISEFLLDVFLIAVVIRFSVGSIERLIQFFKNTLAPLAELIFTEVKRGIEFNIWTHKKIFELIKVIFTEKLPQLLQIIK